MCTDQYVCEWLYYNFVAERFTQKHFAAQCIPLKMIFISQQKNLIHAPFVGLTGNVRSPQVQLVWKPVVDFLFIVIQRVRYILRLRRHKENVSKTMIFKGARQLRYCQSDGREPTNNVAVKITDWLLFLVFRKNTHCSVWFCHKHACAKHADGIDRQTDRQNDHSQNCATRSDVLSVLNTPCNADVDLFSNGV